jgi:hypothetical protein
VAGSTRQWENYIAASLQKEHIVLGCRLKPFCLGHLFLMKRFDIPFASDDPNAMGGPWDLMRAVIICSRTYEQAKHFIYDDTYFVESIFDYPASLYHWFLDKLNPNKPYSIRWFNKWDKTLSWAFRKHWWQKYPTLDAFEEFVKFNEYRKTDLYEPYFEILTHGQPSGIHWSMRVFQVLTSEMGYTQSEAHNLPLARAMVEYYQYLDSIGSIRLLDDFECAVTEGAVKQ